MVFVLARDFSTNVLKELDGAHFEGRMQLGSSDRGTNGDGLLKIEDRQYLGIVCLLEGGE